MKFVAIIGLASSSLLLGMSASSFADNSDGIQVAIDNHNGNIERFESRHAEQAHPEGLSHSRNTLERIQAGERPERPEVARPERPEMPDLAMRPELPDMAMPNQRPETPNRPEHPNNGRR